MNIRRFKDKFRELIQHNEPPHRLALAFAIGVFVAFTPTLGLHFPTTLLVAWVFRLNKLMAILGTALNNPWTFVPICGSSLWVGLRIWPLSPDVPAVDWSSISMSNLMPLKTYVMPFVLGSTMLGVLFASIGYLVTLRAITYYRTRLCASKSNTVL